MSPRLKNSEMADIRHMIKQKVQKHRQNKKKNRWIIA